MPTWSRYLDYVNPVMGRILPWLPRHPLSRAMGWAAGQTNAPPTLLESAIQAFVALYGVNLEEAEVPEAGFSTFDEFFTRKLRADVRPIAREAGTIVSPADGRLVDVGIIESGAKLHVKGSEYEVGELLGCNDHAARYEGGAYAVVYLSPRDYHRVHAPVDGSLRALRFIPGTLYPVNELGTTYIDALFARNERVVFEQESTIYGAITTVMVGALGVGRIDVSFDQLSTVDWPVPNERRYTVNSVPLRRGEEIGVFHLGSTAIVLAEAQAGLQPAVDTDHAIQMGQTLMSNKLGRAP